MKIKPAVTTLLMLLCIFDLALAQHSLPQVTWGINGHPLTQVAYTKNIDQQITDLKDLHVSTYRFDVLLDSDGFSKKDQAFTQLLSKLADNGLAALPVLMQSGLKGLDSEAIYNVSYKQGNNFAKRYGKYFSVIEVNNEADLKIMLPRNSGGTKKSDYDIEKSQRVITAIKGFTDGVKKVAPNMKITLSVSYTHYYYLQLLKDNNVQYDIVGCHWYSNMGPITNARPNGINMLEIIKTKFNKPVWVTEINYSEGTLKADLVTQSNYLTSTIPQLISNGVTGIFVYELYDQPALSKRNAEEAHYGLINQEGNRLYAPKEAYTAYKQLIQGFK
ncbi:hypothetical protein FPZ43_11325 [Mucilaginibacter pallidiroseus]|uniref:Asl1-like glycosyl hydrolase catalytic domain-containing protein n=1 Tax=Mucilaginibacter pallidiroseus TaxID=2599295 RepID=A0A563UBY9_9SPHI|nr:glycosyl hydrolase [Mucilaginibacter pallidiroseus]TWR28854.1 hypothetical protein FPZ43_11325 [Mucilaginibacter pallidiroseus]